MCLFSIEFTMILSSWVLNWWQEKDTNTEAIAKTILKHGNYSATVQNGIPVAFGTRPWSVLFKCSRSTEACPQIHSKNLARPPLRHQDKNTKTRTTRKHGEHSRFLVKSEQKTKQRIQKGKLIKFTYSKINLNKRECDSEWKMNKKKVV